MSFNYFDRVRGRARFARFDDECDDGERLVADCRSGQLRQMYLRFPLSEHAKRRWLALQLPLDFLLVNPEAADMPFAAALHAISLVQWERAPSPTEATFQALNDHVLAHQPDVRLELMWPAADHASLACLTHARHLAIEFSQPQALHTLPLQAMPALESLVLAGAGLDKKAVFDDLPALAQAPQLQRLSMCSLNLGANAWQQVGRLGALTQLWILLPGSPNSRDFYRAVGGLSTLQHLKIQYFNTRKLPLERFVTALSSLRSLEVDQADLGGLAALHELPQLEELAVSGRVADLGALAGHAGLRHLALTRNNARPDLGFITTLPSLRSLRLEGTMTLPDLAPLGQLKCLSVTGEVGPLQAVHGAQALQHLDWIHDGISLGHANTQTMSDLMALFNTLPSLRTFYPPLTLDDWQGAAPEARQRDLLAQVQALGIQADKATFHALARAQGDWRDARERQCETPMRVLC